MSAAARVFMKPAGWRAAGAALALWALSGLAQAQTVTITAPSAGASYPLGSAVNVTATKSGGGIKIRFLQNGAEIGIDNLSPYTASFTPATAGNVELRAELLSFNGTVLATSSPVTVTVTGGGNAGPTVSLTSPGAGATAPAPGSFTLAASASDADGTVASVAFYAGGTLLETDTTAPYSFNWTNVAAGSYPVTAVATDNAGTSTTSAAQTVTVSSTPTPVALTRTYVYDAYKRLCKTIQPESGATLVDYDAAGNIAWTAEGTALTTATCDREAVPENQKTHRSYDAMNRLIAVSTPDGSADVSTTYTADGLVATLTAANPGGPPVVTAYTYNQRRLLTGESADNSPSVLSVGYGYDSNGFLSTLTYPDASTVSTAPDALGRATQVTGNGGETYASGITYYPNGAIAGFTYGNGIVHTLTKNARQLPSRSVDAYGATKVLDDSYTFDANGNVTDITDQAQAGLTTRGMAYDGLDRLTAAVAPNLWGNASYSYDALDNLRHADVGARQYRYRYDGNNRLQDLRNPVGQLQFAFAYDARGNTTAKGSQAFVFDAANRLTQVTGVQAYRYDGQGRRVQTTDVADSKTTFWLYSQSGQVLYSSEARRSQNLAYIYLGNTQVATKAVAWGSGATTIRYQHTDSLGSIVAETDTNRAVVKRNSYEPYGNAFNSPIDGTGYTGHVMDQGTGLTYMQQRYYDPQIGIFYSVDPMPTDPNTGFNFNRYSYANNNPYSFVDPDGRQSATPDNGGNGKNCKDQPDSCTRKERKEERDKQDTPYTVYTTFTNWASTTAAANPAPDWLVNGSAGTANGVLTVTTLGLASQDSLWAGLGLEPVDQNSTAYTNGQYGGYAIGAGATWSAGLVGGSRSVFWSGTGNMTRAGQLGRSLERTPIGSALNALGKKVPDFVWKAASATYAANARGTAIKVGAFEGRIWLGIEKKILEWRGIPYKVVP